MRWVRKSLILIHRYLGTALGLLFFVWFVSGIGMMYAGGMPRLTAELRLLKLPAIDLSRIRLTPVEAVARLNPPAQQASQQQPIGDSPQMGTAQGVQRRGGDRGTNGNQRLEGIRGDRRGSDAAGRRGDGRSGGAGRERGPRRGGEPERSITAVTANRGENTAAEHSQPQGQRVASLEERRGMTSIAQASTGGEGRGGGRGARGGARVTVGAILDRPVYRVGGGRGGGTIVYADDGTVLNGVDTSMAKAIAARFLNISEEKLQYTLQTQADQWTIGQRRQMPLHKIAVDDAAHTVIYISPQSGEVLVLTTRGTRALAWVAAIPHWLYFTNLRVNDRLWNRVIIWTSGIGCFLALLGLVLGVIQFRWSRPSNTTKLSARIPYSGLMRWHYITGVVFGVFTLTWVFSGLLSMDPWEWISGEDLRVNREPLTGGSVDLKEYPAFDPKAWAPLIGTHSIKEIDFTKIQGDPYYIVRLEDSERLLVATNPLQIRRERFSVDSLIERLKQAVPDAHIVDSQLLTDYDSYYYSQDEQRPLPILRAKFDDPKQTWVYLDPAMGQVAGQLHRGDRIQRWLYHGLHSLDFSFWYRNRTAWEIGMIILNLGGAAVSGIGLWLGIRRMGRWLMRIAKSHRSAPKPEARSAASGD